MTVSIAILPSHCRNLLQMYYAYSFSLHHFGTALCTMVSMNYRLYASSSRGCSLLRWPWKEFTSYASTHAHLRWVLFLWKEEENNCINAG